MRALIVGRGQLGKSLEHSLGTDVTVAQNIPWADPGATASRLRQTTDEFLRGVAGEPWLACWSAGAGFVGTPESSLRQERYALANFLESLAANPYFKPDRGSLFLASSAGGIYASGDGELHTEGSPATPASDYGRSKLEQDEMAAAWARDNKVRTLIGRISNLYGPRQDLRKPQGFISHLCRAMATRTLFTLTAPSSTIRDFVCSDDVADRVAVWARTGASADDWAQVKLLASNRSVTLGNVISITTAVSRTRARVLLAAPPNSQKQPASLRFQSRVLTYLDDAFPARPLEQGIQETWQNSMRALQLSQ